MLGDPLRFFTTAEIEQLVQGRHDVQVMAKGLRECLGFRSYRTAEAKEHAMHGLARRVGTLARCVDTVFSLLPPDQTEIPDRETVVDATINIQAFVFNVFGCCDNIAWMWVLERDVCDEKGMPIDKKRVGIGPEFKQFRESCSPKFRTYLEGRGAWINNLKDFRDSLAHRIPLFIPPYMVAPDRLEEHQRLEEEMNAALATGDIPGHDRIEEQQRLLKRFHPIMVHSLTEKGSRPIVFHAQLLADFRTVDEIARKMLEELDELHQSLTPP